MNHSREFDELHLPVASYSRSDPPVSWSERWVRLLDDGIRIPGTQIRFGLDPLVGLFLPAAGDVVSGAGSAALLVTALRRGVPTVVLLRMLINIAIDVLVGAIPLVGDIFDFVWKANRRNLELIRRYEDDPDTETSFVDYVVVGIGFLLIAAGVALPFLVGWWLADRLTDLF